MDEPVVGAGGLSVLARRTIAQLAQLIWGGEVTERDTGLRTGRRISHVFFMAVPNHADTLFNIDRRRAAKAAHEGIGRGHQHAPTLDPKRRQGRSPRRPMIGGSYAGQIRIVDGFPLVAPHENN
jgi:hypothetical protein